MTPLLLGLFNHFFILRSSICRRQPQSSEGECTREMKKKEIRGRHSEVVTVHIIPVRQMTPDKDYVE